jgi:hypothetical protein
MAEIIIATSTSLERVALVTQAPKPLTQEGRILAALGLVRGPLPHAVTKWLMRYYDYLSAQLRMPFDARCPEETGVLRPWTSNVTVIELVPPSDQSTQDGAGQKCKALRGGETCEIPLVDLEVENDHPNEQLIEDYWYWFWNWQFDPRI